MGLMSSNTLIGSNSGALRLRIGTVRYLIFHAIMVRFDLSLFSPTIAKAEPEISAML